MFKIKKIFYIVMLLFSVFMTNIYAESIFGVSNGTYRVAGAKNFTNNLSFEYAKIVVNNNENCITLYKKDGTNIPFYIGTVESRLVKDTYEKAYVCYTIDQQACVIIQPQKYNTYIFYFSVFDDRVNDYLILLTVTAQKSK